MNENETPQPGWYPDPEMAQTQRYWDGSTWTDHRAPAAPQVAPGDSNLIPALIVILIAVIAIPIVLALAL